MLNIEVEQQNGFCIMYDIIIIGAGTAGISAYKQAVKHTQNLLIINDGPWDTTCARVGCMPSKVLIASANRCHDIQQLDQVGLKGRVQLDCTDVMQHVRTLRDSFTASTLKEVNAWPKEHKCSGKAEFIDASTVRVNGQDYQAKAFILAVGSTPNVPGLWKAQLQHRLITSDDIFELPTLPRSVAVIGSGAIAIEMAQALSRLGVKITIFARSQRVGILSSPSLQQLAQTILKKELDIKFEVLPDQLLLEHDQVKISYRQEGQQVTEHYDYVLNATGRDSLLNTLKLEKISPEYGDIKKLPVDSKTKQLGDFPIFIAGDAFTSTPVQHEAAFEGKMLVQNCLNYPDVQNVKLLTPLSMVFCSPEMAIAGRSHKQLTQAKQAFITGEASYSNQGRAKVLGKNQGAVEVYVDPESRVLLGAELCVEQAEHMAHMLAWSITQDATIDDVLQFPFYHPTLEEGLRTALKAARRQLDQT